MLTKSSTANDLHHKTMPTSTMTIHIFSPLKYKCTATVPVWLLLNGLLLRSNQICSHIYNNKKNSSEQFYLWLRIDIIDLYPNHSVTNHTITYTGIKDVRYNSQRVLPFNLLSKAQRSSDQLSRKINHCFSHEKQQQQKLHRHRFAFK